MILICGRRAFDIHDVTRRVIRNLLGRSTKTLGTIDLPQVVVAHNITPSDTATLNRQLVLGFATDVGSRTSHTAIMARSLNIPAVVGLKDISQRLQSRPTCFAGWDKWHRHSKPDGSDPLGVRRNRNKAGTRRGSLDESARHRQHDGRRPPRHPLGKYRASRRRAAGGWSWSGGDRSLQN